MRPEPATFRMPNAAVFAPVLHAFAQTPLLQGFSSSCSRNQPETSIVRSTTVLLLASSTRHRLARMTKAVGMTGFPLVAGAPSRFAYRGMACLQVIPYARAIDGDAVGQQTSLVSAADCV